MAQGGKFTSSPGKEVRCSPAAYRSTQLTRREFLQAAASAAAAVALTGLVQGVEATMGKKSKVVDVRSGAWHKEGQIAVTHVKQMVDAGIMRLTSKAMPEAAWGHLFSRREVVGVKFNQISRDYTGANQALVDAITQGLLSAGLKRGNIVVVEATNAGFQGGQPTPGWTGEYDFGSGRTRLSNFLVNQVDAIINVPNLKHHPICGFTGALKNISHANETIMERPQDYHGNNCDPYIADINALPVVRGKLRLHLLNGLKGIFDQGAEPSPYQWFHDGLLLSRDPVALDAVALRILEETRAAHGLRPLREKGLPPKYIDTAAGRGLGTNDPGLIERLAVVL